MDLMGLFTGVTQGISAYKTAVETLDEAKVAAATNELQVQLTHLGAEVIAMQKESLQAAERERATLRAKNELEDRVRELETRISERARYELVDAFMGAFVYRLKEASADGEPMHYVCQTCLDNKAVKSVIQRHAAAGSDAYCPTCKTTFHLNWFRQK
ncbi:hypothetical protein ABRZ03_02475 [Castellaniella ginsengisoli]|uniref:Uncharacterized protein n=2 Tax=Castellaniella TaxID=359336 RepID=A0AB39FJF7_9BURK|nr:hypothetical protein [Castellaniella denitrificans]MCZ4331074.1 hypothetical protein [Castellaniella denitrificans]